MTEKTEPTVEELQAQILEMKEQNESITTRISELESTNAKLSEDLGNARSLNAKLMKGLPAGVGDTQKEEDEHEETQDEFFDSFINPAIEKYKPR